MTFLAGVDFCVVSEGLPVAVGDRVESLAGTVTCWVRVLGSRVSLSRVVRRPLEAGHTRCRHTDPERDDPLVLRETVVSGFVPVPADPDDLERPYLDVGQLVDRGTNVVR